MIRRATRRVKDPDGHKVELAGARFASDHRFHDPEVFSDGREQRHVIDACLAVTAWIDAVLEVEAGDDAVVASSLRGA